LIEPRARHLSTQGKRIRRAVQSPLTGLGRTLFFGLLALGKEIGQTVPEIAPDTALTGSEAVAIMRDLFGHMLPNLQGST